MRGACKTESLLYLRLGNGKVVLALEAKLFLCHLVVSTRQFIILRGHVTHKNNFPVKIVFGKILVARRKNLLGGKSVELLSFVVKETICVGTLDHLDQNWSMWSGKGSTPK